MVPLDDLLPHPLNSNVMPEDLRAKLKAHIKRTGRYPFLVVRPHPDEPGKYQVLDATSYDAGSVTFQYKSAAKEGTQETVILQGKFIGTLEYRSEANSARAGASGARRSTMMWRWLVRFRIR